MSTGNMIPLVVVGITDNAEVRVEISPMMLPPNALPYMIAEIYKQYRDAYLKNKSLTPKEIEKFEMDIIQQISQNMIT